MHYIELFIVKALIKLMPMIKFKNKKFNFIGNNNIETFKIYKHID